MEESLRFTTNNKDTEENIGVNRSSIQLYRKKVLKQSDYVKYKMVDDQFQNSKEELSQKVRTRKKAVIILPNKSQQVNSDSSDLISSNFEEILPENIGINKVLNMIRSYVIKDIPNEINRKYILNLYQGVSYSIQSLRSPSLEYIQKKSIILTETLKQKKKFLFLDLDETLIRTQDKSQHGQEGSSYKMKIRPFTFRFLSQLSDYFEIYVFTAATNGYADAAIKRLNRERVCINGKLTRDDCLLTKKGRCIKDLRIVKNRELKDIVIIDNLVQSFGFQINNGIPILQFTGQEGDKELLKLIPFLRGLSCVEDVRPVIQERYKLQKLIQLSRRDIDKYFDLHRFE